MPEFSQVATDIKEANFTKALLENNGNAKAAYQAIEPHVTPGSAKVLGSRMLARVNRSQIEQHLEEMGATPKLICQEVLKRANNTKGSRDYLNSARFLAKVGGWDTPKERFSIDMGDNSLEVVDIVRVRLKKKRSSDSIIDVKASEMT